MYKVRLNEMILKTQKWNPEEGTISELWDKFKNRVGPQDGWVGVCVPHNNHNYDYYVGYKDMSDGDYLIPEANYEMYHFHGDYGGIEQWQFGLLAVMEKPHIEVYLDDGSMLYYIPDESQD